MRAGDRDLANQLAIRYDLRRLELRNLHTPVNDVVVVTSEEGRFALKIYHRNRTPEAVRWEIDLVNHLHRLGAPVVQPIPGRDGYLADITVDGQRRPAVLFRWAPGARPVPGWRTYELLGEAAARIHQAATGFAPSPARENYDAAALIDEQLQRMRRHLGQAGRWREAVALGERLKGWLADPALDRGLCHMDLSLDNVHLAEELTVFDFDSAGTCWRAMEPSGVLRFSPTSFRAWLAGYRRVRSFGTADEAAVAAFGLVGDFRAVAWQLGVAASSRGAPLLRAEGLTAVVDGWLDWEADHLRG